MPNLLNFTNKNAAHYVEHVAAAAETGFPLVRRNQEADADGAVIFALGPSLTANKRDLRRAIGYAKRKTWRVIALKEAVAFLHDEFGIVADYAVNMDPGAQEAERTPYLRGVTYLMASVCHPALYGKMIRSRAPIQIFHSAAGIEPVAIPGLPGGLAYEMDIYRGFWHGSDFDVMEGGVTVANRAVSLCRFMGIPRVVGIGMDFGYRPGAQHYVGFVNAKPLDGEMTDSGEIDGTPWHSKPDLFVSACHMARLILSGYVTLLGDSLAAALANRGIDMIERVVIPDHKVSDWLKEHAKAQLIPLTDRPIILPSQRPHPQRNTGGESWL